jgi:arylsulfatase A-like enzyme
LIAAEATASKPNVVIIYGADVGLGDVRVSGSELIPTPNIDQLAAVGLRFNDGHCSAATCTPSRCWLLTRRHGFRNGVPIFAPKAPLSIPTDS